jgi:hypothetical protein
MSVDLRLDVLPTFQITAISPGAETTLVTGIFSRRNALLFRIAVGCQGELQIELKGNPAAMLGAAQNAKRSPETGDLSLQVVMVAGAGFEPATFGL